MPLAGPNPESRAEAHLKWAARYARSSDNPRALSHVRSALKYGELALLRANADRRYEGPTSSKFGAAGHETAPFPAKSAWRKVTAAGEISELDRPEDDHPYRAMADNEKSPNDGKLGQNYLIFLPVTYNENSIYAYFSGDSSNIGGVFVVHSQALKGIARSFADAIQLTNAATAGVADAKTLARLVLTKLMCDYSRGEIRPLPSPLLHYSDLTIDGLGVSVGDDFKKSFAREYLLGMRRGENVTGVHPGAPLLRDMRTARQMTAAFNGTPRSVGNVHWLQNAYTEKHRNKLDYFARSDDEGKIRSLIFAPYSGERPKSPVIRDIGSEIPAEFVRNGNLVNDLTIDGIDGPLDTGAVFAIRVYAWCMLVGCEFIRTNRPWLHVSKRGEESEMQPTAYSVGWSVDEDHTVLVSNTKSEESIKFKFADLGSDRGPMRKQPHDLAIQDIKAVWPVMPNKKPKAS